MNTLCHYRARYVIKCRSPETTYSAEWTLTNSCHNNAVRQHTDTTTRMKSYSHDSVWNIGPMWNIDIGYMYFIQLWLLNFHYSKNELVIL